MLLRETEASRPKVIAFESLYSMDGDIAPIRRICNLASRCNALTYLDGVHAVGLNDPRGAGIAERDGVMHRIDRLANALRQVWKRLELGLETMLWRCRERRRSGPPLDGSLLRSPSLMGFGPSKRLAELWASVKICRPAVFQFTPAA